MTTAAHAHTTIQHAPSGWFARAEAWLDSKGKGAWIAAMILGFIFAWPVGLALLAYMIWSKKMFGKSCRKSTSHRSHRMASTGNSAFDAYREDTLRRLQDEQADFEAFLERLRAAKDKSEFDQFMDDRTRAPKAAEDVRESEDA
ncbi:MAG: DUF2852 domain-containing protein [Paracoccaceae bacterium]